MDKEVTSLTERAAKLAARFNFDIHQALKKLSETKTNDSGRDGDFRHG